ncbi:MAG: DsbC family protein [Proteobacteria bacterium]|nr:DsbC family protein [Pseudomonadota bacterium]
MSKLFLLLLASALITSACSANENAPAASHAKAATSAGVAHSPDAKPSLPVAQSAPKNVAATPPAVIDAIRKLAPHVNIQAVDKTPLPDLWQVVAGGQVVYVSADGRYMFQGDAFDLDTGAALSDARMDQLRRDALAKIPPNRLIRFAPARPKYTVTVFTDVDCPYCRMFHAHIDEYNKAGIAVDYLFWPRTGLDTPSYYKAVSVWCASDRKRAFTQAKAGVDPKPARCDNPVKHDFELGLDLGVDGTPTIIAADGAVLNGYAAPSKLLQWLDQRGGPQDTDPSGI